MAYFSDAERADLLARMHEFDRQLIHEKYRGVVESMEQRRASPAIKREGLVAGNPVKTSRPGRT